MIEAKHQGHGESAHAVLTRDGKFLGTVMREAFDILGTEARAAVEAAGANSANNPTNDKEK